MFAIATKLLTSRLTGPITAGLAALLAVLLMVTKITAVRTERELKADVAALTKTIDDPRKGLRVQLSTTRSDLAQCVVNRSTLSGALDVQSAAVAAMRARADEAAARASAAMAEARRVSDGARRSAGAVLAAKPAAGVDECAAALELGKSR